jgi:tetratricopeptide (TPR) repeat protein
MKRARQSLSISILGIALLGASSAVAQNRAAIRLTLGVPLHRSLEGSAPDSLQLSAATGDFIKVVATQNGTDVRVAQRAPSGKILFDSDTPNGAFGPETVVAIAAETGEFTVETRLGDPKSGKGLYEMELKALRPSQPEDRLELDALLGLHAAFNFTRQPSAESRKSAIAAFEKVIPFYTQRGDRYYRALSVLGIASMKAQTGDIPGAAASAAEAAQLFREAGDPYGEASAWTIVGGMSDVLGEPARAKEAYERALDIDTRAGVRDGASTALNNLGKLRGDAGDWQTAIGYYSSALAAFRELHNTKQQAAVSANLGVVYRALGDFEQALTLLNQALELYRSLKDVRGEAEALSQIGQTFGQRNLHEEALLNCQKARELFISVGDKLRQASSDRCIGRAQSAVKDYAAAEKSLTEAVDLSRSTQDRRQAALILVELASSLNLAGRSGEAASLAAQALSEFRALGDSSSQETALTLAANIENARGNLPAARPNLEAALKLGETNRSRTDSE